MITPTMQRCFNIDPIQNLVSQGFVREYAEPLFENKTEQSIYHTSIYSSNKGDSLIAHFNIETLPLFAKKMLKKQTGIIAVTDAYTFKLVDESFKSSTIFKEARDLLKSTITYWKNGLMRPSLPNEKNLLVWRTLHNVPSGISKQLLSTSCIKSCTQIHKPYIGGFAVNEDIKNDWKPFFCYSWDEPKERHYMALGASLEGKISIREIDSISSNETDEILELMVHGGNVRPCTT